jgi:hypothetical protein
VSRPNVSLPPIAQSLPTDRGRILAFDALGICVLKIAVGAWVLQSGFTHVSDDDYARTVIAEQFAHAPRLDPSGTSWLPLPFWLEGAFMTMAGRTLVAARAFAVVVGAASVAAPYVAMRTASVPRAAAWMAVVVSMVLPWNAWLAVATVPEGWVGALVAAAAIAMRIPRARPWAAAALLAASLSRYEAWPACAVMAACSLACALRGIDRKGAALCAVVAAAGPIAWMAWNAHAHGSALHFLARVSAFRHAIGAADVPMRDKLFGYPMALIGETPEAAVLGVAGVAGMATNMRLRERWTWPMAIAVAIMAFVIIGDMRDGAPTHHAVRALAAVWWILVGAGVDAAAAFVKGLASPRASRAVAWCGAGAAIVWCASLPPRWSASPGRAESERRDAQIERGRDMRLRGVAHAKITPCSFEHFALLAAWGEPENAEVEARTGETPTRECPRVVEW